MTGASRLNYANPTSGQRMVRVWDIGARLFHWGLVSSVLATYLLADQRSLHRKLGYVVMELIAFRLVWGLVGAHHARFVGFIPGSHGRMYYLRDVARGREVRHQGHNLAGAAMIVALIAMLAGISATGWMTGRCCRSRACPSWKSPGYVGHAKA